jgi:hypothetical protein
VFSIEMEVVLEHVVPIKDDEFDSFVRTLGQAPSA